MKLEEAKEYHLIVDFVSASSFNEEVQKYLSDGWQLSGSTKIHNSSTGGTTYYQTVVR